MVCYGIDLLQRLGYQGEEVSGWSQYVPICFSTVRGYGGECVVCWAESVETTFRLNGRCSDDVQIHLVGCGSVTLRYPSVRRLPREPQHPGSERCQIDWRDWLFVLTSLEVPVVERIEAALESLRLVYARVPELSDDPDTLSYSAVAFYCRECDWCQVVRV